MNMTTAAAALLILLAPIMSEPGPDPQFGAMVFRAQDGAWRFALNTWGVRTADGWQLTGNPQPGGRMIQVAGDGQPYSIGLNFSVGQWQPYWRQEQTGGFVFAEPPGTEWDTAFVLFGGRVYAGAHARDYPAEYGGSLQAVPEPGTMAVTLLCAFAVVWRRKSRRKS
jgi:hypothetical protein